MFTLCASLLFGALPDPIVSTWDKLMDPIREFGPTDRTALAASAFLLILVLGLFEDRIVVIAGLLLYSAQILNSKFVPSLGILYPISAVAMLILHAALRGRMPKLALLRRGLFPATGAYLGLSLVTLFGSADVGDTLVNLFAALVATSFAWLVLSTCDDDEVRWSIRLTMGLLLAVSLVLVVAAPGSAIEGDRWRGIAENANSLSIIAALFCLTARTQRAERVGLVPTAAAMLGTSSRAATFGLALVLGPRLMRNQAVFIRRGVAIIALAIAIPILHTVFFTEAAPVNGAVNQVGITRTDNSRADSWKTAGKSIRAHPWTGVGAGNDESLSVHSSVLRPIVQIGWSAVIPLSMIALLMLSLIRNRFRLPLRDVFIFMFVNGLFEGWIFAGGSVYFVVFLVSSSATWASISRRSADADEAAGEPDEPDWRTGSTRSLQAV